MFSPSTLRHAALPRFSLFATCHVFFADAFDDATPTPADTLFRFSLRQLTPDTLPLAPLLSPFSLADIIITPLITPFSSLPPLIRFRASMLSSSIFFRLILLFQLSLFAFDTRDILLRRR
jgi:hypothetical protein